MKPSVLAIRSLGAEFATRLYLPVLITVAISAVGLLGISIWLATLSPWWLILVGIVLLLTIIAGVVLTIGWLVIKTVSPNQTKNQKQQAKAMVDKIQGVAEVTMTPKSVLLFRVMRDVIAPSQQGFISSVSHDTVSLTKDFSALRDTFK